MSKQIMGVIAIIVTITGIVLGPTGKGMELIAEKILLKMDEETTKVVDALIGRRNLFQIKESSLTEGASKVSNKLDTYADRCSDTQDESALGEMITLNLTPPAPITADQDLSNFDSGEFSLNEWLKKRAFKNHAAGASRCFVLNAGAEVIGYYSLSAGAISHEAAPKAMRRNMPNPLPVLLLGRLAVDKRYHNRGIGQALLRDAMITPCLSGEIELDESYFGGRRKGKRGRGAAGKVIVFGLLKRGGKVHALIVPDTKTSTLEPIIRRSIRPDSIVYTDGYTSYDVLDVSEFKHHRINHSVKFVEGKTNHINGIENFWNQAKRHMRRFNGIPKGQFRLFLRECEWRFNYRPTENLFKVLFAWAKIDLL